jgi:hypothetical protein
MLTMDQDCLNCADDVIARLLKCGHDYTAKRDEIARLFYEDLYNGIWDSSTDFSDGTPDLRLIQEDEYDQHMDDEDKPEAITYAAGHYVMLAD